MLKDFVKAILQCHEHDTYQNHRFVQTLQRDIQEDAIAAFELSEPLVRRHFKQFKDSASFVGFLFELCDVQFPVPAFLHRPDDHGDSSPAVQLKQCEDDLQAQRKTYDRTLQAREAFWKAKVEQLEARRPITTHEDCQKKIDRLHTVNTALRRQVPTKPPSTYVHDVILAILKRLNNAATAAPPSGSVEDHAGLLDTTIGQWVNRYETQVAEAQEQNRQCRQQLTELADQIHAALHSTSYPDVNTGSPPLPEAFRTLIDAMTAKLHSAHTSMEKEERLLHQQNAQIETQDQRIHQLEDTLEECRRDLEALQSQSYLKKEEEPDFEFKDEYYYDIDKKMEESDDDAAATPIDTTLRTVLAECLNVEVHDVRNPKTLKHLVEQAIQAVQQEAAHREADRYAQRMENLKQRLEASQERLQTLRYAPENPDMWRKDWQMELEDERRKRETAEQKLERVNITVVDALDEYFQFGRTFHSDVEENAETLKVEIQNRSRELDALRAEMEPYRTEMQALQTRYDGLLRTLQKLNLAGSHEEPPPQRAQEEAEASLQALERTRTTIREILSFLYEKRGDVTDVSGSMQSNLEDIRAYVQLAEKDRQTIRHWIEECSGSAASQGSVSGGLEDLKTALSTRSDRLQTDLNECRFQLQTVQQHFGNVYTGVTGGRTTASVLAADVQEILDQFDVLEVMRKQAEGELKACNEERQRLQTSVTTVEKLLADTTDALNFKDVKFEPDIVDSMTTLSGVIHELNKEMEACRTAAGIEKNEFLRTDLERLRDVLARCATTVSHEEPLEEPSARSRRPSFKDNHPYKSKSPYKMKSYAKSTYFVTDSVKMYQKCIQKLKDLFGCLYEYHFKTTYHSGGWHDDPQMRELRAQTVELDAVTGLLQTLRDTQKTDLDTVNAVVIQFFTRLIGEIRSSGDWEENDEYQCTEIHGYLQEVAARTETVIRQLHHELHTTRELSNVWREKEIAVVEDLGAKRRKAVLVKLIEPLKDAEDMNKEPL